MNWYSIITVTASLLGVIIGGLITYLTQSRIANLQVKRDIEKEKRAKDIEKLEFYGAILKLDGENMMFKKENSSSDFFLFDYELYNEKIRPLLYSKIHILGVNIIAIIREIDKIDGRNKYNEYTVIAVEKTLFPMYKEMIMEIEEYLANYKY